MEQIKRHIHTADILIPGVFILSSLCALALINLPFDLPLVFQITVLAGAVMILGMPHGAYDPQIAASKGLISTSRDKVLFYILYLLIAAAAFGLWMLAPAASFLFFLIISAWHFGSDYSLENQFALKPLLNGTMILALPAYNHVEQLEIIFSYLVPENSAKGFAIGLYILAHLAVFYSLFVCYQFFKAKNYKSALEIFFILLSALFLPPLTYLIVFFCFAHSFRHLNTLYKNLHYSSLKEFCKDGIPLTLASIMLFVLVYLIFQSAGSEEAAQTIFRTTIIMLAVLTVPHMALIEFGKHTRLVARLAESIKKRRESNDPPSENQ